MSPCRLHMKLVKQSNRILFLDFTVPNGFHSFAGLIWAMGKSWILPECFGTVHTAQHYILFVGPANSPKQIPYLIGNQANVALLHSTAKLSLVCVIAQMTRTYKLPGTSRKHRVATVRHEAFGGAASLQMYSLKPQRNYLSSG